MQQDDSIALVIEVVSTNWWDDYLTKFDDYEELQIAEYWLVDFRGLDATRYNRKPKQPTITICTLVDEEYSLNTFKPGQKLISQVFLDLALTTDEIFQAAGET